MATASKATSIPKTLGHFRIVNKIGVGGMGEVYLAHDKKLDRDVALKVLTPELLSDKIARKRFHKEALALSRLNHPRIATVYDFDTQDGVDFLLMEYIPGKTIGEMLQKGAMEEKEVARYGMQLAEGLVAAHDQGVIHRDLKPGNLRVTPDGWLKILDFGLAKLLRAPDSSVTTQVLSETNVAAGTLPYMAPEQLRGEDEDARTDLYTAGVVLYEMATRRRPFEEKVATALAADIMHKPVTPPGRLNHKISTRLEEIILKCMEKEPENRYQTARDLLTDLRRLSSPDGTVTLRSIPISRTRRRRRRVPWALAAGMTMIAALSLWALWQAKPWASQPVARFTVQPAARERLQGDAPSLALSPDGTNLVYRAVRSGRARLYRRPMGELKASALAGTDGARSPFFSPDGDWVAFFADGKLKKVSLQDGSEQTLAKAAGLGGSWAEDGTIVFGGRPNPGLWSVSAEGGTPTPVTTKEKHFLSDERYHLFPQFLPGGDQVLFTTWNTAGKMRVAAVSLETGERKTVVEDGGFARYLPTGHLIYAQDLKGNLVAAPFNPKKLELTGPPVPVLERVKTEKNGSVHFAVSRNGAMAYVPGAPANLLRRLVWVNRQGRREKIELPPDQYSAPRLSPDGKLLALSTRQERFNLRIYDLDTGALRQITDQQGDDFSPVWNRKGTQVIFSSNRSGDGATNLYRAQANGTGRIERLTKSRYSQQPFGWNSAGSVMLFTEESEAANGFDVWRLTFGSKMSAKPFLQAPTNQIHPALSPDGNWLAYSSDESGRFEVYVKPYGGAGKTQKVSTTGGLEPVWSPEGGRLYFRSADGDRVMRVSVKTEPKFSFGKPSLIFRGSFYASFPWERNYDISPDGERFLMLEEVQPPTSARSLTVVLNWYREVEKAAPTGSFPWPF